MISKKKLLSTGPSKSIGSSRITYAESPNSSISNPNLLNKSLLSSTISFSLGLTSKTIGSSKDWE